MVHAALCSSIKEHTLGCEGKGVAKVTLCSAIPRDSVEGVLLAVGHGGSWGTLGVAGTELLLQVGTAPHIV